MNFSGMLKEESRAPRDTQCSQCLLSLLCWQSCVTAGCWAMFCKHSTGDGGGGIQFYFPPDKVVRVLCEGKVGTVSSLPNHIQQAKLFFLICQRDVALPCPSIVMCQ